MAIPSELEALHAIVLNCKDEATKTQAALLIIEMCKTNYERRYGVVDNQRRLQQVNSAKDES